MNDSENIAFATSREHITMYAKIQGTGATPPVRVPVTPSATSSVGWMYASNNYCSLVATDITRASAGVYTMKLRDGLPVILNISGDVWGPAATGKNVVIQDYNPTTRVVSFTVNLDATAAATDLAAADFLVFEIKGQKSVQVY